MRLAVAKHRLSHILSTMPHDDGTAGSISTVELAYPGGDGLPRAHLSVWDPAFTDAAERADLLPPRRLGRSHNHLGVLRVRPLSGHLPCCSAPTRSDPSKRPRSNGRRPGHGTFGRAVCDLSSSGSGTSNGWHCALPPVHPRLRWPRARQGITRSEGYLL